MLRREALKIIGSAPLVATLPHTTRKLYGANDLPKNVFWHLAASGKYIRPAYLNDFYTQYSVNDLKIVEVPSRRCILVSHNFTPIPNTISIKELCKASLIGPHKPYFYYIELYKLDDETLQEYVDDFLRIMEKTENVTRDKIKKIHGYLYQDYVGLIANIDLPE